MKLISRIKPAKAITPSITKTLNNLKINKSESIKTDRKLEQINNKKKVIISKSNKVIKSHSDKTKKAKHKINQIDISITLKTT